MLEDIGQKCIAAYYYLYLSAMSPGLRDANWSPLPFMLRWPLKRRMKASARFILFSLSVGYHAIPSSILFLSTLYVRQFSF